jgi:uncharacterized tellurite resistance protein B-like protein
MSSIAQHFESGEQSRQKGHFRNLVLLAHSDGDFSPAERTLLMRIANRLSLTEEQVQEIIANPLDYPVIPPADREERYERFIQLIQMVAADARVAQSEVEFIKNAGIALGFTPERIEEKFPVILEHLRNGMDREAVFRLVI